MSKLQLIRMENLYIKQVKQLKSDYRLACDTLKNIPNLALVPSFIEECINYSNRIAKLEGKIEVLKMLLDIECEKSA